MSHNRDPNSTPDGFRVLNTSELRELLKDEEKMDQIVRLSEKFQDLQVDRETLLTSNRSLAEESLARRPRLQNGKLQLAEKYKELERLNAACREKQSQLEANTEKHSPQTAQNLLQEEVARAEEESEPTSDPTQALQPKGIRHRLSRWIRRGWHRGSSAGAGSGEFHVYRHLRRREYQRQDFLDRMTEKQKLDYEYLEKVEENQKQAEERTAKRKKKRDKLKQKMLAKKAKVQSETAEDDNKPASSSDKEESDGDAEDDAEVPSFVMGKR
ncbi:hypothetical protein COCON_G00075830 [Conger conger]|uniref:VPS37 C-terminal domain-containing protein n=1 Tax=Conger conger TaxID=82655 RepID=A0A9Q1DNS3_CONCO|nr:hypothetical protein COCON_G00075830 [Conger conger]